MSHLLGEVYIPPVENAVILHSNVVPLLWMECIAKWIQSIQWLEGVLSMRQKLPDSVLHFKALQTFCQRDLAECVGLWLCCVYYFSHLEQS